MFRLFKRRLVRSLFMLGLPTYLFVCLQNTYVTIGCLNRAFVLWLAATYCRKSPNREKRRKANIAMCVRTHSAGGKSNCCSEGKAKGDSGTWKSKSGRAGKSWSSSERESIEPGIVSAAAISCRVVVTALVLAASTMLAWPTGLLC
jgi:hypothetical protein